MAVTIRIKIADYEIEATGPRTWVEQVIAKYIKKIRRKHAIERGKE